MGHLPLNFLMEPIQCSHVSKKRCKFMATAGSDLCGHHRTDAIRGKKSHEIVWAQDGRRDLSTQTFLPLNQQLLVLYVPCSHTTRVERYVSEIMKLTVIYKEKRTTGRNSTMLIDLEGVENKEELIKERLTGFQPLNRILGQTPMIISASSVDFATVVKDFKTECNRHSSSTIKITAKAELRGKLIEQAGEENCDPKGEMNFSVVGLYDSAVFLYGLSKSPPVVPSTSTSKKR